MNEKALPDLVTLLRQHREGLEERLAEQVGLVRSEHERAEKLMTRLEKIRDRLIDVVAAAKKAHEGCRVRDCVGCWGLKQARKTLAEFIWE